MNCFNHNEVSAVAQCQDCGKGLCNQCATQFTIPICNTCNSTRGGSERGRIIKELLLTFGIGFGLTYLMSNDLKFQSSIGSFIYMQIAMFYCYSGLVAGWYTLNRITPQVFLFLPLIGWVFYFVIKMMISIWVGLVMLPIRTFRNIRRLSQISAITK